MYIATVCLMSGLNMNVEKTVVVCIGSREHSPVKFMPELNLNWNPATFKVLGVVFSTNVHGIVLNNYENKLKEMENLLNACLLYTSPSPRDFSRSRMPSSA